MSKYVVVPNGDYKLKVQSGGDITLDTGDQIGQVTVTGDLTVQGTTTTIESTEFTISGNILELNKGEQGAGVSLIESGIKIDRGSLLDVYAVFNETINWLDSGAPAEGAFVLKDENENLVGLKTKVLITNEITTLPDSTLILKPRGSGNIDVSDTKIQNLADPVDQQDSVNLRFLLDKLSTIDNIGDVNLNVPLQEGDLLIWDPVSENFESSRVLENQIIDGGLY